MSDAGRVRSHWSGLSGGWGRVHTATQTPAISGGKHRRAAVLQPVSALLTARGLQHHRLHRCGCLCHYTVSSSHLKWFLLLSSKQLWSILLDISSQNVPSVVGMRYICKVSLMEDVSVGFVRITGSSISTWTMADMKAINSAITNQRKLSRCLTPVSDCIKHVFNYSLKLKAFSRFSFSVSHQQ